jgi:glutathione peroxidase-family protein
VALWLNLNHNNFQKDEQIKLESIDNEIILQLNISSGFNISDLEHQFQHFKDEYFEVIYFTENNILSLKISNL